MTPARQPAAIHWTGLPEATLELAVEDRLGLQPAFAPAEAERQALRRRRRRARARNTLRGYLQYVATLGLLGLLAFAVTAQAAAVAHTGYELDRLNQRLAALQSENQALEVRALSLQSLDRVAAVAKNELGLVPGAESQPLTAVPSEPAPPAQESQRVARLVLPPAQPSDPEHELSRSWAALARWLLSLAPGREVAAVSRVAP